jgi:hypothetical protein
LDINHVDRDSILCTELIVDAGKGDPKAHIRVEATALP